MIPQTKINDNPWDRTDDPLWLLTPDELKLVPNGATLHCISNETVVVGTDKIDNDTRFGLLAYGVLESQLAEAESWDKLASWDKLSFKEKLKSINFGSVPGGHD